MEQYRLPKRTLEMKVTNCKRPMGRPRTRQEDQVKLDLGSRSEEWMNIQNRKIWKETERWKRFCSVTHYSGNA
jgi:hypothetical protein